MFSAKRITPYIERFFGNVPITDSYEQRIADARKALAETDCVLIGAGAGLSTAAGLDYGGVFQAGIRRIYCTVWFYRPLYLIVL